MALGVSRSSATAWAIASPKSLVTGCLAAVLTACQTTQSSSQPAAQPRVASDPSDTELETAHRRSEDPAIASLGPDGLRAHDATGRTSFTIAPDTQGELVCVPAKGIAVFSLGELRLFPVEATGAPTLRRLLAVPESFCAWNGAPLCIVRRIWLSDRDEDICMSIADGSPDTMNEEREFWLAIDGSEAPTSRENCHTGTARAYEPIAVEPNADECVMKLSNGVVRLPGVSATCDVRSLGSSFDGRYTVLGSSAASGDYEYLDLLLLDRRMGSAARLNVRLEALESVEWSAERNDLLIGGRLYADLPALTMKTLGARACFLQPRSKPSR